jgi:hypothetical protein
MTPKFSFQWINWKSVWLYFLSILAIWLLSKLAGLEEMLNDFLDPAISTLVISILWILLKKFVEEKK